MQKAGKKKRERSWRERTSGKEFAGKKEWKEDCRKKLVGKQFAGKNERKLIGGKE
jgi:hypothetical protein